MNTLKTLTALVLVITMAGLAPGRAIAGSVRGLWTDPDPIPKWITVDETSRQAGAVFYQINNDTIATFSKLTHDPTISAIDWLIRDILGAEFGAFTVQVDVEDGTGLQSTCPQAEFCANLSNGVRSWSIPDYPIDIKASMSGDVVPTALLTIKPTLDSIALDLARHLAGYAAKKIFNKFVKTKVCSPLIKDKLFTVIWTLYQEFRPIAELALNGDLAAATQLIAPMATRIAEKLRSGSGAALTDCINNIAFSPWSLAERAANFFARIDESALAVSILTGASAAAMGISTGPENVEIGFANSIADSSPAVDPSTSPSSDASEAPVQRCDLTGLTSYNFLLLTEPPPPISNTSLKGCDFRGWTLANVDFRSTDLAEVNFAGANLERSNFSGANLTGANFKGAALKGTRFNGANLAGADFSGTYLKYVEFSSDVWAVKKPWSVTTTLISGINGKVITVSYPYLDRANFSGATMASVSFQDAILTNVNFSNLKTDESGGGWRDNWYDGASFVNADLSWIIFHGFGTFVGTDFTGADARSLRCGLDLSKAILTGVKLPSCYEP